MTPRFAQDFGTVSLATMIAHALEIQRSDDQIFFQMEKFPAMYSAAVRLLAAHRFGDSEAEVIKHATHLNDVLKLVRASAAAPKSSKPTVGKARDRKYAKYEIAAKKEAEKAERKRLTAFAAAPMLFEGLL